MKKSFPFYKQLDAMDCGPTCLRMIAKYYGKNISLDYFRKKTQYGKEGASLLGLAEAAESIGFRAVGAKLSFQQIMEDITLPAILYWEQVHFVVLIPKPKKNKIYIADPAKGIISLKKEEFLNAWLSTNEASNEKGIALILTPTEQWDNISENENEKSKEKIISWYTLLQYTKKHQASFIQLFIGLFMGSLIQLIFPYLTQSIVDTGINTRNLNFIQIVLGAQLMLLFSQTIVEFIRNKILLHISTNINVILLSAYWAKLLKLPMSFFDSKHPGDILQRINDHHRIESFLTGSALNTLFSIINLFIFSIVLLTYNTSVFVVFGLSSVLYLLWIKLFLKIRRSLDYKRFAIAAKENNATMQLVYGMQEIKLNNAEHNFRWAWEGLQAGLFKINFKSLSLNQTQQIGAFLINQGKNIIITFLVAKLVIEGNLTLGAMLAIQYILGQLNSPVEQLIGFTQQAQDAKISLERLNDIHQLEDEEPTQKNYINYLPVNHDIILKNLSFTYPGAGNEPVLKNISQTIPKGKITAIVGMSGSGKTTLIKLLLKFYENYNGDIYLGDMNFKNISAKLWRRNCGAVMQENFLFNDTIRKNITITDENIQFNQLTQACKSANILSFIESLPLGFYTKLGAEGTNISGGQRQRIAIARVIYKDPKIIFFDEATNALDANNEKEILENLQRFFKNKTVIIVAHRLSTVKNADKIIVLNKGEIVEEGNHEALSALKGYYFELVKNQLELGK